MNELPPGSREQAVIISTVDSLSTASFGSSVVIKIDAAGERLICMQRSKEKIKSKHQPSLKSLDLLSNSGAQMIKNSPNSLFFMAAFNLSSHFSLLLFIFSPPFHPSIQESHRFCD